mmetsp:Transcript_66290/g.183540  ORF Transcript_66290/g.183540 Transcript_66290/m.183540 type:complete len:187 (+) Transcript_66290:110-670(+)
MQATAEKEQGRAVPWAAKVLAFLHLGVAALYLVCSIWSVAGREDWRDIWPYFMLAELAIVGYALAGAGTLVLRERSSLVRLGGACACGGVVTALAALALGWLAWVMTGLLACLPHGCGQEGSALLATQLYDAALVAALPCCNAGCCLASAFYACRAEEAGEEQEGLMASGREIGRRGRESARPELV